MATSTGCAKRPLQWPGNDGGENEDRHLKQRATAPAVAPLTAEIRCVYFKLAAAVRSALRATMKAAPHQLEPSPLGFSGVMKAGLAFAV
jgi:hypothetical protein